MTATTEHSGNSILQGADRTATRLHQAIDQASEGARPMIDQLASGAHRAVGSVSCARHNFADKVSERSEQLGALVDQGTGYVRKNPLLAVGLVAIAVFALSRLFGPRHDL